MSTSELPRQAGTGYAGILVFSYKNCCQHSESMMGVRWSGNNVTSVFFRFVASEKMSNRTKNGSLDSENDYCNKSSSAKTKWFRSGSKNGSLESENDYCKARTLFLYENTRILSQLGGGTHIVPWVCHRSWILESARSQAPEGCFYDQTCF